MPVAPATLRSANRMPFIARLGIALTEIGDRHAVMRVELGPHHRNYFGGVHGGLIATLVDTVSFFARPLLPSGREVTTTSLAVSYVRAPRMGDVLEARSDLLHLGRRTASLSIRVEDQERRLVAHGTAMLLLLDGAAAATLPAAGRSPRAPPKRRRRSAR